MLLRFFKYKEIASTSEHILINHDSTIIVEVAILHMIERNMFIESHSTEVNIRSIKLKPNSSDILSDIKAYNANKHQIKMLLGDVDFGCIKINDKRNLIIDRIKYGHSF